jgi:hypothetical protein
VIVGYLLTAVALGGYLLNLFARARRARARTEALVEKRNR